jgi:hypothetical protein
MRTAVYVDGTLNDSRDIDRGWSIELAIPWKALGEFARRPSPPADGDQWRVNFSRVEWDIEIVDGQYRKIPGRPEHNWVWSPQGVIDMHRPERWGYVQFSTAPPGTAVFRPDPSQSARDYLMQIYEAQKTYHQANGRWVASLSELPSLKLGDGATNPTLHLLSEGFEAGVEYLSPEGVPHRLHVHADSRLRE